MVKRKISKTKLVKFKRYIKEIEKADPKLRKQLYKEYTRAEKKQIKAKAKKLLHRPIYESTPTLSGIARRVGRLKQSKKQVGQTTKAATNILKVFGIVGGKASQSGPGRPTGTYKYGMPIHEYKRLMTQKREKYREYQMEQLNKFQRRGISPEQVKQMQITRTVEQGFPEREVREIRKQDEPEAMADDELAFKKWEADKTLSPSAERILLRLRRVQNKGKADNIRQQRIQAERRMISEKGNLMKAHENMIDVKMDFTGVSRDNILMAPNTFKENPENNILRQKRPSLLNTKEMGNNLRF